MEAVQRHAGAREFLPQIIGPVEQRGDREIDPACAQPRRQVDDQLLRTAAAPDRLDQAEHPR